MAVIVSNQIFGSEAIEQAHTVAAAKALEVYKANTGGVLRRPRPEHISKAVAKAVAAEVIEVLEDRVATMLENLEQAPKLDPEPVETDRVADAEHEGYVSGLRRAWLIVDALEGKPGKRMIRDILHNELRKAQGIGED